MRPKDDSFEESHGDLVRSSLEQILNKRNSLYVMANKINWAGFKKSFGDLFAQKQGRPVLPPRLIVGLHYLALIFSKSDESVVARLLENPYQGCSR